METIGRYLVRREIAKTDYSRLFLCDDPALEVRVAVKLFGLAGRAIGEKARYGPDNHRRRFLREARLLAKLDHPNIISVRDLGFLTPDEPYYVMPFMDGSLVDEIGEDASDPERAAKLPAQRRPRRVSAYRTKVVLEQLLDALSCLHMAGIVHRDVKPANLLSTKMRAGQIKLADFGSVRHPDWSLSQAGIWFGTPNYMSPEQQESADAADARSDIYSAGAVAYRMLTGVRAVGKAPPPQEIASDIPQPLGDLVMAMLSATLNDRPQDGMAALRMLRAVPVPRPKLMVQGGVGVRLDQRTRKARAGDQA